MNILKTALLLIVTLVAVPLFSYFFGTPLNEISTDALQTMTYVLVGAIVYCFVVGEVSGNNSQVDKLWSLLPIVYSWIAAYYGDFSLRLVLMSVLVSIWGVRLTYNFSRHGAFTWKFWEGTEDYRWEILRKKPEFNPKWKWTLFNLFFICTYQLALIMLFTLPILVALQFNDQPMSMADWLIAAAMLGFIVMETIADQQQWDYQKDKRKALNNEIDLTEDLKKGFLDQGLWSYSRHPNYFAEQSIWVCFYLFSITTSGQWFNWSIAGSLLLLVLFQGSSNFSEEISASKYPGYKSYQKKVPRFFGIKKSHS